MDRTSELDEVRTHTDITISVISRTENILISYDCAFNGPVGGQLTLIHSIQCDQNDYTKQYNVMSYFNLLLQTCAIWHVWIKNGDF